MRKRLPLSLKAELAERNAVIDRITAEGRRASPRTPALARELAWRNNAIARWRQPAPASDFVQRLERSGRGRMTRANFVRALVTGRSTPISRDEFIVSLERGTRAAPRSSTRPSTRTLLEDPAARDRYVKSLTTSSRPRSSARSQATEHAPRRPLVRSHGAPEFMPRENLIRGLFRMGGAHQTAPIAAMRSTSGSDSVMEGHFAVFNEWTEIDSLWEGNFMESIAPGAFSKTFRESRASMRVLFQHGRDPVVGDKPLGVIEELNEDDIGAHYAVPLFDTSYNADLRPALAAGQYGASFRFSVIKEEVDNSPAKSDWNPHGIPQRVIREMRVFEFGPVTFPAYASATAGLRSLTDYFERAA